MNKWPRIKNQIYQEKLNEVSGLFNKVKNNIHNGKVLRSEWLTPLESWTSRQIKENSSLRLSLHEFADLTKIVDDIDSIFAQNAGSEDQVINEGQSVFTKNYNRFLESKNNDLKLEVSAELIEEKQFPLEIFAEWYGVAYTLPPEQFNEELGSFWGDVWKHAAGGAGYGGLAGTAAGGFPGTFAGAGIGGLAGGLYGGASNLLKRVWQYRQTQRNFEQTKQKAVEALKKLKELSQGFEMHPNFIQSLDSMIDQLGSARAYRMAGAPKPTDPNAMPGEPVNPMKQQHPGWAELGKHSAPSGPTPTTVAPPVTATPPPTAASAPVTPPVTATPPPVLPGKRTQNISDEEREIRRQRMNRRWAKKKQEETERQAALAAAIGGTPPAEAPADAGATAAAPAPPVEDTDEISNKEDFIRLYNKVKDNPTQLARLGTTLNSLGLTKPGKNKEPIVRNIPFDVEHFNQHYKDTKDQDKHSSKEEADEAIAIAHAFAQHLGVSLKPDDSLGTPGAPKETPSAPGEEQVKKELKSDEELEGMKRQDLEQYIADFGLKKLLDDGVIEDVGMKNGAKRSQAVKLLRWNAEHPEQPTESAFTRIGKMFRENKLRSKLESLPIEKRGQYLVTVVRG